jgi:ABC-type antimicrobial peptide transport system permease subunit
VYVNVRSAQPASILAPLVRAAVAELDRETPLQDIRTLNQVVRDATASERAVAGIVDFFMATALGLVAVGLYGTLSYHIVQRTREIGVRLAIGAIGRDILRLVLVQGMRWVAIGLVIGIAGTFALSKVLKGIVYGMDGITATPLLIAMVAVAFAATAAILVPAWRASRLDPIVALRID